MRPQTHADTSVNAPASLYSASAADTNATLRYVADTCKSLCLYLPTPSMVRLGQIPILCRCLCTVFLAKTKMFASAHLSSAVVGINGDSRRRGRRRARVINERLMKLRTHLWSLCCIKKVRVHIMHVNFNFPFNLGPKGGLCIIHECIL